MPHKNEEYEFRKEGLVAFFPKSKYFQIHFQHCHENAYVIIQELNELKRNVVAVEAKLDHMMEMLQKQAEHV